MQPTPPQGYSPYPHNGQNYANGPAQQPGPTKQYPQMHGDGLSSPMGNLQIGTHAGKLNGQHPQQYQQGTYNSGPPQQFAQPLTQPPIQQAPQQNVMNGVHPAFSPAGGPQSRPPMTPQNNQGHFQGAQNLSGRTSAMSQHGLQPIGSPRSGPQPGVLPPLAPPSGQSAVGTANPSYTGAPPSLGSPPQYGGPASGSFQYGTAQTAPTQYGVPPSGPPQLGGPSSVPPQSGGPPSGPPQLRGPPSGPPQLGGPPSGPPQLAGPPSGPPQLAGPPSGPPQLANHPSGPPQLAGPPSGPSQLSGPNSGPQHLSGPPSGPPQLGGPPSGPPQLSGPPPGPPQLEGPPSGPPQLSGPPSGPQSFSNSPSGPPSIGAPPSGHLAPTGSPSTGLPRRGPVAHRVGSSVPSGQFHAPQEGVSNVQTSGQFQEQVSNGPPSGQFQGPPGGTSNGPPSGQFQGPPVGLSNGPPNVQFQSPPTSAARNPSLHPLPGGQNYATPHSLQGGQGSAFQPPPQQGGYPHQGGPAGSSPYQTQIGQGYSQAPPAMYNGQYTQPQAGAYQPQQQHQGYQQQQGGYPHQHPASPPEQRKLDPDVMPSPIQVIQDDKKNFTAPFVTSKIGMLPPLVTTDIEVQDEGNAGPNYIRSTVYTIPCSPDVIKQTQLPLALALTPFARHARTDGALPLSVFNEEIVRCNGCKAYMCPFMQFVDGGRRFQCVFCTTATEVPQSYFNHLDHVGDRVDKWQRAELCLGSYEIQATQEYCRNQVFPKSPPAFIFVLDVSYNAVKCGMTQLFCQNIKSILEDLPTEEEDSDETESSIRVGFITYSSQVHFYNVDPKLGQPKMMVVPDINDIFVPFLEGFLVKPKDALSVIENLVEEIPKMFSDSRETETILGPAIQAGLEALKEAECPGKLFVFVTSLPIAEAPGKLKNRDDRKLLGTDKEKTVLTPGSAFYQELGAQCVQAGCSVDLFVANNSFVDIATIGQVAKITGGEVYKYTYFQAETDGERFLADLRHDVSKPIAFDCVMRVRTSRGFRPTDFYGNLYIQNTTDVELASIDSDKCITVELKYDDKLPENECAYVQVALLYTSVKGVRKLRLHNLKIQTATQMADMYRNCELDVIMNFLAKQSLRHLLEGTPKGLREATLQRASTILANYRKHCATSSASGQLILPECMKLLPLYTNCITKCDAISGGPELTVDDRAFAMLALGSMDVKSTQVYIYPRLFQVDNLNDDDNSIPVAIRTSVLKLRDDGAFLLENGIVMFLYLGQNVDSVWCEAVFGVASTAQIDPKIGLIPRNTPQSKRIHSLIAALRSERPRFMKLYIVRQGDQWERVLRQFLVEDRMSEHQLSYVDYLCLVHKEIRNLIS